MSKWQNEKQLVIDAALKMSAKGLVVGKSGNVSIRLPPENGRDLLAITPSRKEYDTLVEDDIQVVDFEADPVEGDLAPSVETMMHIGIYRARPNIGAVIHTHSVFASVLAVAGRGIPPILEDQVNFIGGEIALAAYAASGSEDLVQNVVAALGDRNAALLANHGAVGIGRNVREAFTVCELLEKTARVYCYALNLGKVVALNDEAVETHRIFFKMMYGNPG